MEKNKPESIVTTNKIKFGRPDFTAAPESQKAESIVTTNKVDFGGIYKALQAKDDAIFAQQVTSTQFADAKQRAKAAGIAKRLKIDNVDLVQQNIDEYEAADKRKQFEDYVKLNPAIRDMDADKRDEFLKRIEDEKTAEQLYRINNNLRVYGREERPFALVAFAKKMSYSWQKGKQTTVKTGRRVADIMKSRNLSEYEERQLLNAIKDEQKEYPELASNPLSKLFYMGAETLPYTLKTGSWTFGGEIAGTGASMLLKRWPVAAIVSKIAGRAVGAIGAFNEGKEIEAGNLYLDLMTMKDDDGNVIDRETCQTAAEIYGSVSAAIETAGSEMLTGVALKANFLKRAVLKKQILELAKKKELKHWLAEFGKRAVVADLSEAAEEGLQEAASVFMENRAKAAANENGADFALSDYAERVTDATIKGGQGAVVISFAGAGSGTAISARENRRLMAARSNKAQAEAVAMADKAVLDEIQKDAEQALPTPETQEDAARNRQFFQKAFKSSLYDKVYLEIEDADAFLASDAYQANKEWLDEIGFTDLFNKKIALAKDIGGVVSLSAADYATYITPKKDVYSEFTKNMKTSEDGMKLGEAEERGKMRVEILRRGEQLTREREADADFLREYFNNRYDGAALQRKPFVEYMTKVALTMSERANMTVRDFIRAYPFNGVVKGHTGQAPSVSAYDEILSAIRDEIRSDPEEAVRRVSEMAAKKDIRAIRNILSKKIENANAGDIKKFIRLANAIRDMKLDLSNMTDDQIQTAINNFTTAPQQPVVSEMEAGTETLSETGDLFKASGASKAESALKDIQETGGDYVVIGSGRVPVAYEVRDISTINTSHTAEGAINPNYPQRFQPRDRSDVASREQIQNIVASFMPERVGVNAVANEGAPIIDANGNVLVGNGRAMAISEVLKNPEKAAAYKEYLKGLGYLSDMENPILVRRLTGDMTEEQLDALVADANASGTMRYSVAEQALTDASKMTPNLLNALDVDADIGSLANKEFVKGVFNDVIPSGERNGLMVNGQITQDGIERIENALVAMLVQDKALLDTLLTKDATGKNDNRKIASGLAKASPAVLYFENEIENKKTIDPAYSIADDVRGAVYVLKRAIGKKMPLNDYLAQMDFLEGGVSAAVQYVARIFDTMPNAAEVRNRITDYIRLASTEGDLMQGGLFATPSQTKEQILQSVSGKQPALYQQDYLESLKTREGGPEIAADDETVEVTEIEIGKVPVFDTKTELRTWLIGEFNKIKEATIDSTNQKVIFDEESARRVIKNARNRNNNMAYPKIKEIIRNALYSGFRPADEKHSKVIGQDVYHSALSYDGEKYRVEFYVDIPKYSSGKSKFAGNKIKHIKIASADTRVTSDLKSGLAQSYEAISKISMGVLRGKVKIARVDSQNKILYQAGNIEGVRADINSAEFKKWSHNAPFYEANKAAEHNFKTGEPLVAEVFHGTQRADRVGDTFLPSRATSGPMAFSTDTRFIAENYAKDKNDTSIYNETEGDFYKYYTVKIPNHDPVTLDRLWNILPYAKKKEVREKAPHITLDDNGENVVYDEKETRGNGGYYIEGNQNPINALVESWPNAGYFFDEKEKFQKVLELAGLGEYEIQYIDPYASYPKVYELYVEMQNPLVTKDIPKNVLTALKREAKNQPRKTSNYGADPWDKNTKDPIEWINGLDENNTYIWTSIPDWVTNTLKKMGYDGIVDTGGKSGGYGHNVFIPFESQQYKSVYNEGAFNPNNPNIYYQPQNEFSAPFGAYDPIRRQITIFENSNLSTILHESGHFWYDVFKQIAQKEGVSDRLKNDYKTLDKWLTEEAAKRYTIRKNEATKEYEIIRVSSGAVENSFLTEDEAVNATKHECFARGLEAYFRDFDVPVAGLSRVFAMFRRWLMGVYRSAKALDIKIIPPVREVFDRMIATDEEILEYQSAVRMKKILDKSGTTLMTDEDFEKYSEMFKEASDVSRENYMKAQAEVVAREQTRQFKERKEQIREREIEEKCRTDKKFLIDRVLMFGKVGEVEYPDMTLDEEEVTRAFKQINVKRWRLRPNGKPIFKAGGMKMSEVAQFFGVTIDEVADAVFHINQNLDNFEKELTEIVHEELGDPVSVDDILERLRKSNATDIQQEILLTELSVLTGSETNKTMLDRIMRNYAEAKISKMKLRDLKPQVFLRNALRAQDKAVYFAGKKNMRKAAEFKEMQIRNFYLQRECERQLDVAQKSVKRLQEIGKFKKEVNRLVEQTHQDAARALLSRFGLAVSMTQAAQERMADLAKWVGLQIKNGYDIALPDQRLLEMKRTSYRDLTVDDFLTIRDCVLSIIYNGRQIKEFELEGEKVRKDEAIQKIEEALSGRESIKRSATSNKPKRETAAKKIREWDAALVTLGGLAQMVDGANMNGIFHKLYLRPLTEAQNLEFYLNEKYAAKVGEQMKKLPSSIKERLLDVVDGSEEVLGQAYNMEDLISFGLNMGTYSNLQRLKDGNKFGDSALQWIRDQIPVEAWEFIQGVWDVLDEMRPMLQDHHKKMSGLDMDEVIAVPFMVGNREFRGGYYPIVYDYSAFLEAQEANSTAKALLESDYGRPTTATGYTKARADKVRMPVKTGLGVLSNHIQAVIHDVAYRKTLRDLWNITTDQRFIEVFDDKIGVERREALQGLLKSIGNKVNRDNRELKGVENTLKNIRHRATFIGLAYRLSSALAQLPGLASSVAWLSDVGKKSGAKHGGAYWIAKGCRDIINPDVRQWIEAKSGEVKARLASGDQNLAERIRALRGKDTIRASVETYGYWLLGRVDFLVSMATWKGAYEQAINDLGYGEQDAIFYADRAMNESQGSGNIKESVAFQRGSEFMKMASMFYTPFAAEYQLNKRLFNDLFHVKDLAGFTNVLSRALALYLVSGCLGDIIAGNAPDKDESWLAWAIKSSFNYMIGAYPVLRDISSIKFGSAGKMPYGRWFDNAANSVRQIEKAMEGNATVKTSVRAAMTTLAYGDPIFTNWFIPISGQMTDTAGYLAALIADEVKPKSFSDILLGLYKGRERK